VVTAKALLEDLRGRGARITASGGRLRVDAPRGVLSRQLQEEIRGRKSEILRLIGGHREPTAVEEIADGPVAASREEVAAVRIRSSKFGDVWLAHDRETVLRIAAEGHGLPVLTVDEVLQLRGKDRALIQAILDVKAVFPSASLKKV
jgi:hypothetical protein